MLAVDAGVAAPEQSAKFVIYDARLQPRHLSALMLVCAGSSAVRLDAALGNDAFRVLDARHCQTNERVRFLSYDVGGGPVTTVVVPANTCLGQQTRLRLVEDDFPPTERCLRLDLGASLLSATGEPVGVVRTTVVVKSN
ncbi:MAG: hypothetical protein K1X89_02420 [Myxococcaceae bacterium]|nr:hypothetical protein [Myxococcaceae bacterium]